MTAMMMLFWDLHAAAAADDDDGGGGDDDDDDNDNDDNYDDDDAFTFMLSLVAPDRPSMAKPSMWTTSLAHYDTHQEDINASHLRSPRTCESRPAVHRRKKTTKNKNFDRRLLSTISALKCPGGCSATAQVVQSSIGLRNSALHAWKAGDEPRRTSHHASHGVEAGPNGR